MIVKSQNMTHQKHTRLAKPSLGRWGRSEWAILGTTCDNIQALATTLSGRLSARWKTGFVDADHKTHGEQDGAFFLEWTDKIGYHRLDFAQKPNLWEQRALLNDLDLVLVNGNHFEAGRQILALDRRKFDSISRKLERLTHVELFLTKTGDPNFITPAELPDFLKNHVPAWADIPVLDWSESTETAVFLEKNLRIAPVKALVLAGGKSTRMGQDKAELAYHGRPQWRHLRDLLQKNGLEVFISCRADQAGLFAGEALVTDTFIDLGPLGAILSAFRHDPDAAWLVLACDLPLFDAPALDFLLQNRNPSAAATAFRQPENPDFPEPLVAIWEPKSYARMLSFLAQGVNCPRKVLINSDTNLLNAPHPAALMNANTPEERVAVMKSLGH